MDVFTLTLPLYNRKWGFNRSHFLELFPNSLISNTLENSRDTDIEITQPFVTPEAIIDSLDYCRRRRHSRIYEGNSTNSNTSWRLS